MPDKEIYGSRDLLYSGWHRTDSIKRYIGFNAARQLLMMDVDCVEMNAKREPVAFVECARYKGPGSLEKKTYWTEQLAKKCGVFGYVLLYVPNKADNDIESFYVRRVWPNTANSFTQVQPAVWARRLVSLRNEYDLLWQSAMEHGQ